MTVLFFESSAGPIWIIGDSIVRGAKQPLGLARAVLWNGRSGAMISDIRSLMAGVTGPPPAVIVFHIGTNDLLSVDAFCIRQRILVLFKDTMIM